MTSRQIDVLRKITEERKEKLKKGDELPPGRHQAGQGLHRHEAQALHRRQNGRPPTATRASSRASFRKKICLLSRMARRWKSFLTLSAFLRV